MITQPGFHQPVFTGRLGLADARCESDDMAVPIRADIRRQDRPRHIRKTPREERRGRFDDVMLRLEPGNEMRFLLAADFAKADGGLHPVLVAVHGLHHRLRA